MSGEYAAIEKVSNPDARYLAAYIVPFSDEDLLLSVESIILSAYSPEEVKIIADFYRSPAGYKWGIGRGNVMANINLEVGFFKMKMLKERRK